MQTKLSTACLSKMLSNAIWAQTEAYKLGVSPLITKYTIVTNRLREALKNRMVTPLIK